MKNRSLKKRTVALLAVFALLLTSCSKTKEFSGTTAMTSTSKETIPESTTIASSSEASDSDTSATADEPPMCTDEYWGDTEQFLSQEVRIPSTVYVTKEESDAFKEELKNLPGVVDVRQETGHKNGQYIVSFEMPLDHKDPSKGTFKQRVYVYYKGKDRPNLFFCGGYGLHFGKIVDSEYDRQMGIADEEENDFSAKYNCNFIEPEFRLYEPGLKEMDYKNIEYWSYLTDENASEDFHFMIEKIKTILDGKWVFEGVSKGGSFTSYQLGRHPDDADLFVVEAGLTNHSRNMPGLYEYAYTVAGDDRFGKETAKKYRDMILELQVELIKHRQGVKKYYLGPLSSTYSMKPIFSSDLTEDIVYECAVLDLVYGWQNCWAKFFADMEKTLALKNEADKKDVYEAELGQLLELGYNCYHYAMDIVSESGDSFVGEINVSRFMFQNYREDGNYLYDFSYLRKALEKDGSGAQLTISEDMEESLFEKRVNEELRSSISYDPSVYETRTRAIRTTEKPVIIVNGTTDVCHLAGVMESDNPNVHIFNIVGACHHEVTCAYLFTDKKVLFQPLSREERDEYNAVVNQALGISS